MSTADIHTIHDVIAYMESLDTQLRSSPLSNLRAFNTTYLIITKSVAAQLGKSQFEEDLLMEKFDIIFARYYFDALDKYQSGQVVPSAWKTLFDACKDNNLLQCQYMALGVNAHVNNDLPFALHDTGEVNKNDFLKINLIIKKALPEVIKQLHEQNKYLELAKNISRPIYAEILTRIIRSWRRKAWSNYKHLSYHEIDGKKIEIKAAKLARYLKIRYN